FNFVRLDPFLRKLRSVAFNFALERSRLAMHVGNRADETLTDSFLQMKLTNFMHDLQTRARNLATQARQFLRGLAASQLLFSIKLRQLFQSAFVKLTNV